MDTIRSFKAQGSNQSFVDRVLDTFRTQGRKLREAVTRDRVDPATLGKPGWKRWWAKHHGPLGSRASATAREVTHIMKPKRHFTHGERILLPYLPYRSTRKDTAIRTAEMKKRRARRKVRGARRATA